MTKKLSEMSLEELWELFPIFLEEHNEFWSLIYSEEETRLLSVLPHNKNMKINHIGSTSINDIWAKPIIDILLEIPKDESMETIKDSLTQNEYICMCEDSNRKDFNKGYTNLGFADKVFHVHLRYSGDNDELYFRDYMNDNPILAKQYENMKLSLWKKYEHNRDAYTYSKGDFIKEQTHAAKNRYGKRY